MTIIIVILVIIILIAADSSKSSKNSGKSRERSYGSKNNTTERSAHQANNGYTGRTDNNIHRSNNSPKTVNRTKTAFVDRFLDGAEQSRSDYDKKESKKLNLEMRQEFDRIIQGNGGLLIDDLEQHITAEQFKAYSDYEWVNNAFLFGDCYQTFRCGFFRRISTVFPESGVDEGKMLQRFFDIRNGVEKKVINDYKTLGEETAKSITNSFKLVLGQCLYQGESFADEYIAKDIRIEKV